VEERARKRCAVVGGRHRDYDLPRHLQAHELLTSDESRLFVAAFYRDHRCDAAESCASRNREQWC
jgi:hypothetical protein